MSTLPLVSLWLLLAATPVTADGPGSSDIARPLDNGAVSAPAGPGTGKTQSTAANAGSELERPVGPDQIPSAAADRSPGTSIPRPQVTYVSGEAAGRLRLPAPDTVIRTVTITEDTTWAGEILVEGVVTVGSQATLKVEPGTVVRFGRSTGNDAREPALLVLGRLVAVGASENPIIFASGFRDTKAGDWQGIVFLGSEKKNLMEQCRVEGARKGVDASYSVVTLRDVTFAACETALDTAESYLKVTGGEIRNCGTGIVVDDAEAEIRGLAIAESGRGMLIRNSSVWLVDVKVWKNSYRALSAEDSRLHVSKSTFATNGDGIRLVSVQGSLNDSIISSNAGHGLYLDNSRIRVQDNFIEKNGGNGLYINGTRGIAWGNVIVGNGGYDCYNAATGEVRVIGNWWGTADVDEISTRIYDRNDDPTRGPVMFQPLLPAPPATPP